MTAIRYPNGMSKSLTPADLQEQIAGASRVLQSLLAQRDIFVLGFLTAGQVAKNLSAFSVEELESEECAESAYQVAVREVRRQLSDLEAQFTDLRAQIEAAS